MVLSRVFTEAEYATYRQTLLVFNVAGSILGLGLAQALLFSLPTEKHRKRGVLLECMLPVLFCGAVFFFFMLCGGNRLFAWLFNNPALAVTLLIVSPIALLQLTSGLLPKCMVATDHVETAAIFGATSRLAVVFVVLIAVWFFPTVNAALFANIFMFGLIAAIAVYLMLSVCQVGFPTFEGVSKQLAFGIPFAFSTMIGTLSRNIDRTMVSIFCIPEQYALFENGALELPLVQVITGSMTAILMVDYRVMLQEGQTAEVLSLLQRATMKSATFLIPLMFLLLCVAPEFMVCLFSEKYRASADVFRIYLLLLPIRTLVFSSVALASGRTRSLAVVATITLICNVILNYFAIRSFGYIGSAVATVVVIYCVSAFGRATIARDILQCSMTEFFPWKKFGTLMLIASVAVPAVLITLQNIPEQGDAVRLLIGTSIYAMITFPLMVLAGFVDTNAIVRRLTQMISKK